MIGLFDSGVGGLSIAQAVAHALPGEALLYFADSGNAPYGERAPAFVLERSRHITRTLLAQHCSAIVVACNTASGIAINNLRVEFAVPFIAVEPAVKPALALSTSGAIAVMATANTLSSARFAALCARLATESSRIIPVPCPGLAEAIEQGLQGTAKLDQLLVHLLAPLAGSGVDTVALGCTHYAFAAPAIQAQLRRLLGEQVQLVDNAQAVARQVEIVVDRQAPPFCALPGLNVLTTGDAAFVSRVAQQLLGKAVQATRV